jgi:hypothetical protein
MNMAIMAQAMGGPRAGTAMLSLYNQVATGKMTKPAALGMQDLGLLGADEWKSDHGHVIIDPKAEARLGKILGKNPMDFVDEIYKNLEAQGITDPDEQKRCGAGAMSRQTSERFVIEQMMNREQMAAERERMAQGAGSASAAGIYDAKSITANEEALANAWHNLQVAVAGPQSENVIRILKELTGVLNGMQMSVNGMSPETVGMIAKIVVALGFGLVALGGIALVALAGVPGLIVAGVAAISAFVALNWAAITAGFDTVRMAISGFVEYLASIPGKIANFFTGGTGKGAPTTDDLGRVIPQSFHPGNVQPKATPISLSLNVDGRTLAQSMSEKLDDLLRYDTAAPAFNGAGRYGV